MIDSKCDVSFEDDFAVGGSSKAECVVARERGGDLDGLQQLPWEVDQSVELFPRFARVPISMEANRDNIIVEMPYPAERRNHLRVGGELDSLGAFLQTFDHISDPGNPGEINLAHANHYIC